MTQNSFLNFAGFLKDLLSLRPKTEILEVLGLEESEFNELLDGNQQPTQRLLEQLLIFGLQNEDLFALLIQRGVLQGITLPSYNIYQPFEFTNLPIGFDLPLKSQNIINRPTKIAGFDVNFPIGVSASVLMGTSDFVRFYSKRGFDILTYKTVRTQPEQVHKFPNWAFVPKPTKFEITRNGDATKSQVAVGPDYWPNDKHNITMANSFGVPSLAPEEWEVDVRLARSLLKDGQLLIVSVMATTNTSKDDIALDYAAAAVRAKQAGAQIIELNLSCPNVPGETAGQIYRTPATAAHVCKVVRQALTTADERTPLFIKIGYLESTLLGELVNQVAEYIDGIVAINTIAATIINEAGEPYFPNDEDKHVVRRTAGISGAAIRPFAHEVIANLVALRNKNPTYKFDILAAGGVQSKEHVDEYLQLGANGVMSCTGAMMNPELAIEVRNYDRIQQIDPTLVTRIGDDEEVNQFMKENLKANALIEVEPGVYEFASSKQDLSEEFLLSVLKKGLAKNLFQLVQISQRLQAGKVTLEQAKQEIDKLHR